MPISAWERHKTFAPAHRSNEKQPAYISVSRNGTRQVCLFLLKLILIFSPLYCILRSIASCASSSSAYNFPNCFSPWESASVYANYLRSHYSVSQPKAFPKKFRGYLSEFQQASCLKESYSSFCSLLVSSKFLAFSFIATGPDRFA